MCSSDLLCQRTAAGTLAPGDSLTLSFSTRVSTTMDGAPLLENRACTGETALSALGLGAADGPQPPGNGQTANDCAIAGGYLRATTATTRPACGWKRPSHAGNVGLLHTTTSAGGNTRLTRRPHEKSSQRLSGRNRV